MTEIKTCEALCSEIVESGGGGGGGAVLNWGTEVTGTDQPRTLIHQWNLIAGAASALAPPAADKL